jgi:hypothetical protein
VELGDYTEHHIMLYFILTGCVINVLINLLPFFKTITVPGLYAAQAVCLLLYAVLAIILDKKKYIFKP